MRVLLTGATGFIGSRVARELLARDCVVESVIRTGSDTRRIDDCISSLQIIRADLANGPIAELKGAPPDACIHLAWYCDPADYRTSPKNSQWVQSGMDLLETVTRAGCRRIVMAGTCFEYGPGFGLLSESTPIVPLNFYAACKNALHEMARRFCDSEGISLSWVRPFHLHGPWENPKRLVPYVVRKLLAGEECPLTKGDQVRDFLHVDDVASAICDAAMSTLEGPLNIGSGRPVTVAEIASELGSHIKRPDLLKLGAQQTTPGDPPFICADITRLTHGTGWAPRFDLVSGLADTIEFWRNGNAGESNS